MVSFPSSHISDKGILELFIKYSSVCIDRGAAADTEGKGGLKGDTRQ